MDAQFLNPIVVPLSQQSKCELTPNEHSMYIRFLCVEGKEVARFGYKHSSLFVCGVGKMFYKFDARQFKFPRTYFNLNC
jgi:hypothetical protein